MKKILNKINQLYYFNFYVYVKNIILYCAVCYSAVFAATAGSGNALATHEEITYSRQQNINSSTTVNMGGAAQIQEIRTLINDYQHRTASYLATSSVFNLGAANGLEFLSTVSWVGAVILMSTSSYLGSEANRVQIAGNIMNIVAPPLSYLAEHLATKFIQRQDALNIFKKISGSTTFMPTISISDPGASGQSRTNAVNQDTVINHSESFAVMQESVPLGNIQSLSQSATQNLTQTATTQIDSVIPAVLEVSSTTLNDPRNYASGGGIVQRILVAPLPSALPSPSQSPESNVQGSTPIDTLDQQTVVQIADQLGVAPSAGIHSEMQNTANAQHFDDHTPIVVTGTTNNSSASAAAVKNHHNFYATPALHANTNLPMSDEERETLSNFLLRQVMDQAQLREAKYFSLSSSFYLTAANGLELLSKVGWTFGLILMSTSANLTDPTASYQTKLVGQILNISSTPILYLANKCAQEFKEREDNLFKIAQILGKLTPNELVRVSIEIAAADQQNGTSSSNNT